jgi:hypothetical protein
MHDIDIEIDSGLISVILIGRAKPAQNIPNTFPTQLK